MVEKDGSAQNPLNRADLVHVPKLFISDCSVTYNPFILSSGLFLSIFCPRLRNPESFATHFLQSLPCYQLKRGQKILQSGF